MAASVPPSLKAANIARLAQRAVQLETAKPIVAYYCKYQIVNQILAKGLHNADQESIAYTTRLMDDLEQFKAENQTNDAVTDDIAGKIYVEQFALDTLQRADNAVRANKASRQTAETFQAAATFLELLHIWGTVDPEITSKIIYAKFHAVRIAKALKAGEDPNLSNPVPEPEVTEEEALPALDPNDADVQMLIGAGEGHRQPSVVEVPDEAHRLQSNLAQKSSLDESLHPSRAPSVPRSGEIEARQPSMLEVPDDAHRLQSRMARQSSLDESLHPSRAPSIPPAPTFRDVSPPVPSDSANHYASNPSEPDVSPIAADSPTADRKHSTGGNYFPQVSSPFAQPPLASINAPSAPIDADSTLDLPNAPSEYSLPNAPSALASTWAFPPLHRQESPKIPPTYHGHFLPQTDTIPPNLTPQSAPRQPLPQAPPQLRQQPVAHPVYSTAPPAAAPLADNVVDEEAVMKAQKHARWAISALNFEDIPTAIKELRGALETLGAR